MCQFVETMLVENDNIVNINYHNRRLNHTLRYLSSGHEEWEIGGHVYPLIKRLKEDNPSMTVSNYKARLLYDKDGIIDVSLSPYSLRMVGTLKFVECDDIDYTYKSADRTRLNQLFSLRGDCDDVLIIRNGMVTDTSICNVAFWDGKEWLTPESPLLEGTRRASLIDDRIIREEAISMKDITHFQKICLFNAMIGWERIEIDINSNTLIR